MKRSEFLKRLGLGIAAIPLVPKIAAEAAEMVGRVTLGDMTLPDDAIVQDGDLTYSHYEEPFVHSGWPLRIGDIILRPGDQSYYVSEVWGGEDLGHDTRITRWAKCIPLVDGDNIIISENDEVIRISNLNREL